MNVQGNENKSSTGLEPNVAALLAYLFNIVGGLIFFLIEKDSLYVRFHAMQSILLSAAAFVLWFVIGIFYTMVLFISSGLGGILWFFWPLSLLAIMAVFILMMVKAYQGEAYKLPFIGDIAENIVNK